MRGRLWRLGVLCAIALSGLLPVRVFATTANDLCAPAANPCVVSTAVVVSNGSVIDVGARELRIAATGDLDVASGAMTIMAGNLNVLNGGRLRARGSGSAAGGTITIRATTASMAGLVDVKGTPAGAVFFVVDGVLNLSGQVLAGAASRDESGGLIRIDAASATISGALDASGGTEDSLGGDIELSTSGNLVFSGSADASGPDGGSILFEIGVNGTAGNLILTSTADIDADGKNQAGFGGTIDLIANGDGVTTGLITLGGVVTADGAGGGEELGGGAGGCINVTATGEISGDNANTNLGVQGGGFDGDGGEIEIVSDAAGYSALAVLDVSAGGEESGAGAVSIDAFGPVQLRSEIDATAADGGDVSISSSAAGITVLERVKIDASGSSGGSGGDICLESASLHQGNAANVLVMGSLLAVGGNGAEGGVIELDGVDSVRVSEKGVLNADGGNGGGFGNTIALRVTEGPALIEGNLTARGNSREGGIIAIDARRIDVRGRLDVRGAGSLDLNTDSMIGLRASGAVDISGVVDASASPGVGGLIEINSDGRFSLSGTLTSDGGMSPGGQVTVTGCDVLICGLNSPECPGGATGLIRTNGPDGTNRLIGRESIVVLGNMMAATQTGRNLLVYRPGTAAPVVLGNVVPNRIVSTDASLESCVVCGNNIVEPPETCDDGNTEDGDGCSAFCEEETAPPGDVNGDSTVDGEDIRFAIAEIFDGDGDSVTMVSRGTFRGTPGADANGDRLINAGDLPALLMILGAP